MRGRKKTPANVLQLRGNPGKRPINQEPQFEPGIPDTSLFYLNEMAKKHWDALAPELDAKGILAKVDGGILAAYCSACSWLYYAEKDIEKYGAYQTGEFGIKKHPAVLIAKEARDQIRALGSELGVTATSRARIKATPKDKEKPQGARRFLA
jgi:P27 family predicted phage terminase small subunit